MIEKCKLLPAMMRKIHRHYAENGITGLTEESLSYLARRIVDRQKVTADEIVEQSDKHRFWVESKEETISISEPDNKRLRQEFKSFPKEFDPQPGVIYEIQDCDLVGPYAVGLHHGKRLIHETCGLRIENEFLGPRHNVIMHGITSRGKVRPDRSAENIFPLICPDPSYYHWMVEYLPKLRFFESYCREAKKESILLIESNPRDFVCDTLKLVGYDRTQYREWNNQETRVEELVVTTHRPHTFYDEKPELSDYSPSMKDLNWLRDRVRSNISDQGSNSDNSKRVYISREDANRGRKVINQNQLSEVLDKHGFKIYKLESLSFRCQLQIICNADMIMGPHGAGLLNIMFAKNPTVIELFPDSIIEPYFYFLSQMFDFDYTPIITNSNKNNLIIDAGEMDRVISNMNDT